MKDREMDAHREAALLENVEFLESCGLHREQIERRTGKTWDAIEKARWRRNKRSASGQPDPTEEARTGTGEGEAEVSPLRSTGT